MLLLSGASGLLQSKLTPATCRWCEPDRLDRWARGQLRWRSTKAAGTASDALQLGVPAATALALWLSGGQPLASRETAEDLVVVAEAAAVAQLLTQGAKYAAARRRPDAWAAGTQGSADAKHSFWSAHTSFTFSVAAAATQVARLRGRPGWRWLALASFAGAAATGWLRVAADRHWLTDVVSGAAVGTATGLGVPLLVLVPEGARATPVGLAMAPGGLALTF
jgi:membrane-associated phospholipid phosphatase